MRFTCRVKGDLWKIFVEQLSSRLYISFIDKANVTYMNFAQGWLHSSVQNIMLLVSQRIIGSYW